MRLLKLDLVVSPGRVLFAMVAFGGCQSAAIHANQQQLQQQQAELNQLKQEIHALQTQSAPSTFAATTAGACDENVRRAASRKGGERFAADDFAHALPYYQDAVNACPQSASAHLNLARTYEALGNRVSARTQYQLAAASADQDAATRAQARDALARLKP